MLKIIQHGLLLLLLFPTLVVGETAWVIDRVTVGLHQENSLDSPILKLLATGAELEVLAKDNELTQVKDEAGTTGWIQNDYLNTEKPTRRLFEEVNSRNQQLKNRISKLETRLQQADSGEETSALKDENNKLKQELKSARLKSGELEAELTKLRKTAGTATPATADNRELYTRIAQLEQQNIALEEEVQRLLNPAADASRGGFSIKAALAYIQLHYKFVLVSLLLGLILGLVLYDFINRKRHSGFRV